MMMQERSFTSNTNENKFSFNGKDYDKSINGSKTWQDYGFRHYDTRLSRFVSIDPLASKYPELATYQFASLTPIWAIDIEGLEAFFMHGTWGANKSFTSKLKTNVARIFGNTETYTPGWSGTNTDAARQEAAADLVEYIKGHRKPGEAVTIMGHSHGGNVAMIAAQLIAQDPEFDGVQINVITLNTPAREYRIDPSLQERINHYHIYNPNERKVVPNGGKGKWFSGMKSGKKFIGFIPTGEKGPADHDFYDADYSIEYVEQYQDTKGFLRTFSVAASIGHQGWRPRNVDDWLPKIEEAAKGNSDYAREIRGHGGSGMGQIHFGNSELNLTNIE
jgi:RHS repeat-associated protein